MYRCERKIRTLAENDVALVDGWPKFDYDEVTYSQWDFNFGEGWKGDAWLASANVEANNLDEAYKLFRSKLLFSTSRVSLLAQCYTDFLGEPLLIHRTDLDMAYVQHVIDERPVPLHFTEDSLKALIHLGANQSIPDEFFYYWNDATNVTGYTAKLLLLFSAIEALCKDANGKIDKVKRATILNAKYDTLFYQNNNQGLRHRLVHGEYMQAGDTGEDYVLVIHKAIVEYFNNEVFSEKLITEGVIGPQRNFNDNKASRTTLLRPKLAEHPLTLKALSDNFDKETNSFKDYEDVYDFELKDY